MASDEEKIVILNMVPDDEVHIRGIIKEVYQEYGCKLDLVHFDSDLWNIVDSYTNPGRSNAWTLFKGDDVIGSVCVKAEGHVASLHRLYISPKERGNGYGKLLLDHALEWCKDCRFNALYLWSDVRFKHAHKLYRDSGFEFCGYRRCGDIEESRELQWWKSLKNSGMTIEKPVNSAGSGGSADPSIIL